MKAVKKFLLVTVVICCSSTAYSQYYYYNDRYYDNDVMYELGGGVGAMNCITDVGGANSDKGMYINEIRPKNTRFSTTFYFGATYKYFIGARLEATWGQVTSADADITSTASLNLTTKNNRNLSFRSSIAEVALVAEFHPLELKYYENGPPRFSPYIAAGIGVFSFNPQTQFRGHWIDLKNLHLEGQGFAEYNVRQYKTTSFSVPMGIGVRYELSSLLNVRLEFLHRLTFTDYLDDASSRKFINPTTFSKYLTPVQAAYASALYNRSKNGTIPARRGDPTENDSYMSLSLKIGLTLGRESLK